jgi:hypothetical protein
MTTTTPNLPVTLPSTGGYDYDVFVSYAEVDADWCLEELIVPLRHAGITVIHEREFNLGETKIGSEDDAILRSRHTLAFLTSAYLDAKWQSFVIDRVLTRGPAGRPLIPVLAEECDLPVKLDGLVHLDFTDPDKRGEAIRRLLENLGRSAQQAQEVAARAVIRGIRALARLMRVARVQAVVARYEASFQGAAQVINRITWLKTLHDDFQVVQGAFTLVKDRRRERGAPQAGPAVEFEDELEESLEDLIVSLDQLIGSVKQSGLSRDEVAWEPSVRRVWEDLRVAVRDRNAAALGGPLLRLQRDLGSQPGFIDTQIVEGVAALSLERVADELLSVHNALSRHTFDAPAQARFQVFAHSVEPLYELGRYLGLLYRNHNWLQRIEGALLPLASTRRPNPYELADLWVDVVHPLSELKAEAGPGWFGPLQDAASPVSAAVVQVPTGPAEVRQLQNQFNAFRTRMDEAFNRADRDLLQQCGRLREVGEALRQAIREMQNG